MNDTQRAVLEKARRMLNEVYTIVEDARNDEQDKYDNLPEGFQNGSLGESIESAIECLDEALDKIEDAKDSIDAATV